MPKHVGVCVYQVCYITKCVFWMICWFWSEFLSVVAEQTVPNLRREHQWHYPTQVACKKREAIILISGFYTEPGESSPHHCILFVKSLLKLSYHLCLPKLNIFLLFFRVKFLINLSYTSVRAARTKSLLFIYLRSFLNFPVIVKDFVFLPYTEWPGCTSVWEQAESLVFMF